ncbi:ABC transporter permease [Streptococcus pluranimalium]|uniref:ABC transporter permease n=1 Tax=Streptococcus pluranimalium TaxID=82348 RepID=UPI001C4AFBBE|nr:ABC transporter permease [Streptococcus pluranimalium]MDY3042389.1 ABC transporter permease [Streptococcus pluranimalium]WFM80756.1 ABC transporter permease [Streptococcus pluranimalium]HEM6115629.1 ABC transporter permease [Streptococcus suis]
MFLALNEIKHAKLRYGLILGLLFLIAYLMFFLTGLAFGLMQDNRSAVDKWQADTILLNKESNELLSASTISKEDADKVKADNLAPLSQMASSAWTKNDSTDDEKEKVSLFGIEKTSFLAPNITQGRLFKNDKEVVIDQSLAQENDFKIGQTLQLASTDKTLKIVGYTDNAMFSVAPVLYMNQKAFNQVKYGEDSSKSPINALVVKGKATDYPKDLKSLKIADFIKKLPGYNAQNLTFGFMIGFLIIIASVVIGIFMYVLTIQKAPIFGVMKVQGISSSYIGGAVMSQTFLLSLIGTSLGLLGTWLSSLALPAAVPFQSNWTLYGAIGLALIIFALLGTLFSVRSVSKIDPLVAIS